MDQPQQTNILESKHWTVGSVPPECTRIDVRSEKGASRMMALPPQLQVISLGLVADCFAQGFIFEEDQAKVHELLFEAMSMIMRLYLMLFFLEPSNIENMVVMFHEQAPGHIPPLSTATLALKDGVMFDAPEVSQAILQTQPTSVVWMSVAVPEGENHYVVSFKILTPSLIANADITFGANDIDLKTVVDPRYPEYDPFHYVSLVPILNLDEYTSTEDDEDDQGDDDDDADNDEEEADNDSQDGQYSLSDSGDYAEEVADLPQGDGDVDVEKDEAPPFEPDEVTTASPKK